MQVRRSRHQLYKHIDGDYYGFRDEEDGTLLKAEVEAESLLRKKVKSSVTSNTRLCTLNKCFL